MKLSNSTLSILQNFATINQSIQFKKGSTLKTISPQKTIMAKAELEDEFPQDACIYDLSRFLSVYSLYEDPEIEFEDTHLTISEGGKKTKYVFATPSMLILPPEKELKLPSTDVSVDVRKDDLESVKKASAVLQTPEIAFVGSGGVCSIQALNSKDPSSDSFGVDIGTTDDEFCLIFDPDNLRMMKGDYKVELSSKGISRFASNRVEYYIAIDAKSTYEKSAKANNDEEEMEGAE